MGVSSAMTRNRRTESKEEHKNEAERRIAVGERPRRTQWKAREKEMTRGEEVVVGEK